jgi:hypothetical protein
MCHNAPNPMLLVAKAGSNWLKLQNIEIIPGCDLDEDNNTDTHIYFKIADSLLDFAED